MNSFLFSAITLCLAAQCALAQYQSAPAYGGHHQQPQRKMAPTPQTYGSQQASSGYGAAEMQQYEPMSSHYEQAPAAAPAYRAPSSAATSQYDERTPAASSSYGKPAPAASYGRQQQQYQQQPSSGYGAAKPAAKYEEPYHPPMPFAWGYDINDGYGGAQYHKENGDEYGKRTGSYGYTDAYGIYRQVDYVADENGFRATIKTNEPGTANESPADVELHAYEPPSNFYAGNKDSYASAAPAKSSYGSSSAPASSYSAAPASSYGSSAAPASSSYSSSAAPASSSYSSSAAPASSSYGSAAPSSYSSGQRSQYQQQASSYGAPAQHQRSSYGASRQQPTSGYSAQRASSYEPAQQYSSSVIVPVYRKAASSLKAAVAPAANRY